MSLKRKLEGEVEIREGAADVYHDIYKSKPHHVAHASPHFVQSCDLHEGELGKPGSIIVWKYKIGPKHDYLVNPSSIKAAPNEEFWGCQHITGGDKTLIAKVIIEEIDEKNKFVKQRCIEGDLLDDYKTITATCQVIPKDQHTCLVRWTLEYEKLTPQNPEPSALLDSLLSSAKDIDDHHHGVKK